MSEIIKDPNANDDQLKRQKIKEITDRAEAEARAKLAVQEGKVGSIEDYFKSDENKLSKKIVSGKVVPHTHLPNIEEGLSPQERWEKFKQARGINERDVQKRKDETGVGVEVPSEEEVRQYAGETKKTEPEEEKKSEVKPEPEPESKPKPKTQRKPRKKRKGGTKAGAAKKKARQPAQKTTKKLREEVKEDLENKFEKDPTRTDWKLADVIEIKKMNPAWMRAYSMILRDARRMKPNLTYAEAKVAIKRAGHPMAYRGRMANRNMPIV